MSTASTVRLVGGLLASVAAGAPASRVASAHVAARHQAIKGDTIIVRIVGDSKGYRFEPSDVRIQPGGVVRFVAVSGTPHNITFDQSLPDGVKAALRSRMANTLSDLSGPLLLSPGDSYTISFAGVPAGTYAFHCTPHFSLGETGQVTVSQGGGVAPAPAPDRPSGALGFVGTGDFQGAIRGALAVLARRVPGQLSDPASVPPPVGALLRTMVTAQEAYFADSSQYTKDFDQLRRAPAVRSMPPLQLPGGAQPLIMVAGPGYWFAVLGVPGGACAVGVNVPNPLSQGAGEGEPACRMIRPPGSGGSDGSTSGNVTDQGDRVRADLERAAPSTLGYLGTMEAGGSARPTSVSVDYTAFSIDRCTVTLTERLRTSDKGAPQVTTEVIQMARIIPDSIGIFRGSSRYTPAQVALRIVNTNHAIVERDETGEGSPSDVTLRGQDVDKLQAMAGNLRTLARVCASAAR